jgi:Holliday junction resolvase
VFGSRGRPLPSAAPRTAATAGGGAAPYKLGRQFEVSVREQLRRRGYFVIRSYGSKGLVDEVAVGRQGVLFVQAKRLGSISSREWNALYELAREHGATPVVAMKLSERVTGYFRLDGPRVFRSREKPWVRIDPASCEGWPEQIALP